MGRTLYLDCFSGISGDMVLGALLDLGMPLEGLREALGSLAVDHGAVSAVRVVRAGITATKFETNASPGADPPGPGPHHGHHHHAEPHHHEGSHHSLGEIETAVRRSALSAEGKDRVVALFRRLAEAEGEIHGVPVDRVHLHEVGALDSIIDIVGAVYWMEWLGASEIVASPVNVGGGTVTCAHGTYPVPAPATARLLTGVPVYAAGPARELTTPTGALLVTGYAQRFGALPAMRVERIGYGAGSGDFPGHPNVLRMVVGETAAAGADERIVVLECEIDDMNPQLYGPLMDRLTAEGALDVFYAPVQMKKNRPGTLVTVIAYPGRRSGLTAVLLAETTTLGVRYQEMLRERLDREIVSLQTPLGAIRFKVASRDGKAMKTAPEFEDCARIAGETGLPVKDVQAIAMTAWLGRGR